MLLFGFGCAAFIAQSSDRPLNRDLQMRNPVLVLYTVNAAGMHRGGAIARAALVHTDFERKGFFRIGLLPLVAVEKFRLEALSAEVASDCFGQVQIWFASLSHGGKRLELREPELVVAGPTTATLKSGGIRVNPTGSWDLFDGVTFTSGTNRIHTARATLQVTGARSGRLVMQGNQPVTTIFFPSKSTNQAKFHEN